MGIKLTAVIIGSLSCKKEILKTKRFFEFFGVEVFDPVTLNIENRLEKKTLYDIQKQYVEYIGQADFVIAIPKEDGTFGESTSYELVITKYFYDKPIFIRSSDTVINNTYLRQHQGEHINDDLKKWLNIFYGVNAFQGGTDHDKK